MIQFQGCRDNDYFIFAIKLFFELLLYTTVTVSKNRSMIQFRCCRVNDYVIFTIKRFFELLLRTMVIASKTDR